jgi:flagellar biogenesis protein FliO
VNEKELWEWLKKFYVGNYESVRVVKVAGSRLIVSFERVEIRNQEGTPCCKFLIPESEISKLEQVVKGKVDA